MNNLILSFTIFLLAGIFSTQSQSKQDSLFLQSMEYDYQLKEGQSYIFERELQLSKSNYDKSSFIEKEDKPQFDALGNVINGLPYSEFGTASVIFDGAQFINVNIGDKEYGCCVLSFICNGKAYNIYQVYRDPFQKDKILNYGRYNLIATDYLNRLDSLLIGKVLYPKQALWSQYHEDKINSNLKFSKHTENTCKYCPVTVTQIINDYDDKYIVCFKKENDNIEYCIRNVQFYAHGINRFLNFTTYFTFNNPQKMYPNISNKRWVQIMNQKIEKGFTSNEVKIAYGKPDRIVTENDNEIWYYYNYCLKDFSIIFKNGKVSNVISSDVNFW